jgi:hypothetical protein
MKGFPVLIFALGLLAAPTPGLCAELPLTDLRAGADEGAVLKDYGPPIEKSEFESKRQELWRYARGSVLFHEGRVISVIVAEAGPLPVQPPPAERSASSLGQNRVPVEEILGEIARQAGGAKSGPPAGVGQPVLIEPRRPPPER